jgi:hypothetical protein
MAGAAAAAAASDTWSCVNGWKENTSHPAGESSKYRVTGWRAVPSTANRRTILCSSADHKNDCRTEPLLRLARPKTIGRRRYDASRQRGPCLIPSGTAVVRAATTPSVTHVVYDIHHVAGCAAHVNRCIHPRCPAQTQWNGAACRIIFESRWRPPKRDTVSHQAPLLCKMCGTTLGHNPRLPCTMHSSAIVAPLPHLLRQVTSSREGRFLVHPPLIAMEPEKGIPAPSPVHKCYDRGCVGGQGTDPTPEIVVVVAALLFSDSFISFTPFAVFVLPPNIEKEHHTNQSIIIVSMRGSRVSV